MVSARSKETLRLLQILLKEFCSSFYRNSLRCLLLVTFFFFRTHFLFGELQARLSSAPSKSRSKVHVQMILNKSYDISARSTNKTMISLSRRTDHH